MEELQISRSKVNDVGIASLKGLLSFEGMAEFICVVVKGVHWYFPESSLLSLTVLSDHDTATLDCFTRISCSTQSTPKAGLMIHLCPCRVEEPPEFEHGRMPCYFSVYGDYWRYCFQRLKASYKFPFSVISCFSLLSTAANFTNGAHSTHPWKVASFS